MTTMKLSEINVYLSRKEKYPAKQHVQRVANKLAASEGLIYLLGQYGLTMEDSDQMKTWKQRRYFYYCSGVDVPNCCLTYNITTDELVLYIPAIQPDRVVWMGRGPTIEEAYEMFDVDVVRLNKSLFDDLKTWRKDNSDSTFYILHKDHKPTLDFPNIDSEKLQPAIDRCRAIKDHYEIERIRSANAISASAHSAVLRNIRNFTNEAQVQGIFEGTCTSLQAKKQAYSVIAGSGENASVLHYSKNDEPLKGRQLFLLDAGAEWENYTSDVTRTFPISGYWPTRESEAIYRVVEEMQESCIAMLRPGAFMWDLHTHAAKVAIRGLLGLGILQGSAGEIYEKGTWKGFYPHGLGHHVGLEVHDILGLPILKYSTDGRGSHMSAELLAPCRPEQPPLEAGMVVTIEPGIYFSRYELNRAYLKSPIHSKFFNKEVLEKYWAIGGARIEDDLLITNEGCENLTTAPKGDKALKIIREGHSRCK